MSRSLWFDPSFGASGDMILGALVGVGADLDEIITQLEALNVDGWSIAAETVIRNGISANRVAVTATHGPARHWSSIDALLADSTLPPAVVTGARATFRLLGEVEAIQHQVSIDEVHFHEVGAVDAIVDIVGGWLALDQLRIDAVAVGPVGLGHGTVTAAHGALPIPAPATLAILNQAPTRALDAELETCTPTGAALLATMGTWGQLPGGTIAASARGAGGKNPPHHPNVLTAIIFDSGIDSSPANLDGGQPAYVLSTNVDDVSPEVLGHAIDVLLDAGADDAWVVPMSMKKSRPAHEVHVLASAELIGPLQQVLSRETGSLGSRIVAATKFPLPRHIEHVEVHGHQIGMKVGPHGAKPEHDDLLRASAALGIPIRMLSEEARLAWRDICH